MNSKIKVSYIKYIVLLTVCILNNNTANAIPVTFDYQGQVDTIRHDETGQIAAAGIKTNTRFFGSFSYNSNAAFSRTHTNAKDFPGISISVEFESGAKVTSEGLPVVQMYNDNSSFDDGLNIVAGPSGSISSFFDYDIHLQIQTLFLDSSGTLYSSLELPSSIEFSDFTSHRFHFIGRDIAGVDRFTGNILSVERRNFAPVPLPTAIWFFASGLVGLLGYRRTKASDEYVR